MGCSNARLLVQAPPANERTSLGTRNPSSSTGAVIDSHPTTTRMHLTGVDLVVERNGSYTLLLTPKTHKQLMPYVLRKKRFRILVDKNRSNPASPIVTSNEPVISERVMETSKQSRKDKKQSEQPMESTLESLEQVATDELNRVNARFIGGRSIDRGNPEDDDDNIQSDDEGMIEEIVTTVEEDKDLECKVKKKIETKKTTAQDPETHNKITKVVKTEVTEITRTITINDQHDLARAKRELGIDDANRFSPWTDESRATKVQEKVDEPINEIITQQDLTLPCSNPQTSSDEKPFLAEATAVGRGPVIETVSTAPEQKSVEIKKKTKKKKAGLCSCTRAVADDEPTIPNIVQSTKKPSLIIPMNKSVVDTQIQGQSLISSDTKQLIIEKKFLLIDYIHSTIFSPTNLFSSSEEDFRGRKISSRILDLLRYDRCSSWSQMFEQLQEEYPNYLPTNTVLQPMIQTYEHLFTHKHANLVNTFSTIHHENDLRNISENHDYLTIIQTYLNARDNPTTISPLTNTSGENLEQINEHNQESIERDDEKVANDAESMIKQTDMPDDIAATPSAYNEEQLIKMLGEVSQHQPITLAEAIAYEYIDIDDPKLGLSSDTIQRIKNLFRPLADATTANVIRVKRSGEYLTDVNLTEVNPFEKLNLSQPLIYQLQQSFEPTLDFSEAQFRSLTETILNNKEQYDQFQFDIARTSLPIYDLKESSANDFSQSDSGYSMTTATHESLASKIKIEFEPICQDISTASKHNDFYEEDKIDLDKATSKQLEQYKLNQELIQIIKSDFHGSDKTIGQAILSRELRLESTDSQDAAQLKALGIDKDQAKILTAFFFPKQTRIIAYSPEPGRFVEAQTTYNPDYPTHKTDTTIIQIQEKQLSSDHHAMQRQVYDDRTSPISIQESELIISSPSVVSSTGVNKDKSTLVTPVYVKKRKSMSTPGLLSCFKSKKPKAGTEQQGQPTITPANETTLSTTPMISIPGEPLVDYSILPDGKRIYIDAFRERIGMDMSYKPNDFDNRYVLPIAKSTNDYERPMTPEVESIVVHQSEITYERPLLIPSEPIEKTIEIEPTDSQSPPVHEIYSVKKPAMSLHAAGVVLPEVDLVKPGPLPTFSMNKTKKVGQQKKSTGGLCASCFGGKARKKQLVSESIQAPIEQKIIIHEEQQILTSTIESPPLVDVPILPRVNIDTFREQNFQKCAENLPKTEERSTAINGNIRTTVEIQNQVPSNDAILSQSRSAAKTDLSIFSRVNIDTFKERTFEKYTDKPRKVVPTEEVRRELPADESVRLESSANLDSTTQNESVVSRVNIDIFKERIFTKNTEYLPKCQQLPSEPPAQSLDESSPTKTDASNLSRVNIDIFKERTFLKNTELGEPTNTLVRTEEPHYQLPSRETLPAATPVPEVVEFSPTKTDASIFSQVNIDTFKERTFLKSTEVGEPTDTLLPTEQPPSEPPVTSVPVPVVTESSPIKTDASIFSRVNIDTFKERTFLKNTELGEPTDISVRTEEPHHQLPSIESVKAASPVTEVIELSSTTTDTSIFSRVNIDTFKERTFEKSPENIPKLEEPVGISTSKPVFTEECDHQLATPANPTSVFSKVNIDTFRERTFDKTYENLPKSLEEPHYQLPTNQLVSASLPIQPTPQLSSPSVVSRVNIDTFKERTFTKNIQNPPKLEEPHYQLPSDEPIALSTEHEYAVPERLDIEHNTYDIPRFTELQSNDKMINNNDMQKSSGDFLPTDELKTKSNVTTTCSTTNEIPSTETPKKKKKKSGRFSALFRTNDRTMIVPAFDLPSIDFDRSSCQSLHHHDSDPLRIPTTHLPQLDVPLPTFDRPEVDMTTGQLKSTSEFGIPTVQFPAIPDLNFPVHSSNNPTNVVQSRQIPIETDLTLPSPVPDMLSAQTDHQNIAIEAKSFIVGTPAIELPSQQLLIIDKQTASLPDCTFPLPSSVTAGTRSIPMPPSFDDDVPTAPSKIVPAVNKQQLPMEMKSPMKQKKSSPLALCSCLGEKSSKSNEKTSTFIAPKVTDMSLGSQTNESLRANVISSSVETKSNPETITTKSAAIQQETPEVNKNVHTATPLFTIKAPAMNIPPMDLSGVQQIDGYSAFTRHDETKSMIEPIQSRSDSGLEAIVSAHLPASSTLDEIAQLPSVSSGFGSEILDGVTTKDDRLLPEDFHRSITMTGDIQTELNFRQDQLKKCLGNEISQSIDDFDNKHDRKSLDKILHHAIDLIKKKKVSTYTDLQHKLTLDHKHDAFLVDPIVRSLFCTIEKQGLDNIDKPQFPLAIRDMVRLPTHDTVPQFTKETSLLRVTQMTTEIPPLESNLIDKPRSCFTCGRGKSTSQMSTTTGLLDERRRGQLNIHRNELPEILREHIQSSQPAIRKCPEHPKDIERIIRKCLILINQPKTHSYEQMRHELKCEYKQIFYLVDPIVDIIRDTFDHCDITQMTDKTNLDILNSHITQTAHLYNHQLDVLTSDELTRLQTNQLSWLSTHFIDQESKDKKLTRKLHKQLSRIIARALDILSLNVISTWEDLTLQLQREYGKSHDLCARAVGLIRQGHRDGLFALQQAPTQDQPLTKRRPSSLVTERAKENLKTNRAKISASIRKLLLHQTPTLSKDEQQLDICLAKTLNYLEEQQAGQFKDYLDLKQQLKNDFPHHQPEIIEQIVDVIEQAHAANQFDDIDKAEVQTLMKDRLHGQPLVIKEMYVSLPPRLGAFGTSKHTDVSPCLSTTVNGDRTLNNNSRSTTSHRVGRGLSWREANERARILFYRGKHPAIHYDEQAAAFDVRMLLETASGGTQEIPVTDSDVHELLNSCGVQWDGVNIISLVDHSEDVVRAAEQAALKVIREKGLVDLRTPPITRNDDTYHDDESAVPSSS